MIRCETFFKILKENELNFFTGVPDSTFKDWMKFLEDESGKRLIHLRACNECEAIALATGYNLATKKIGVVYMQNSGEGKTINPLTSLCDEKVYSIPLVMLIGWRGKPGEKEEPQHKKMGKITLPLLKLLNIPYIILSKDERIVKRQIRDIKNLAINRSKPVAIIIEKGTFSEYSCKKRIHSPYKLKREDVIKTIVKSLNKDDLVVSTTGKISRELFEYRNSRNEEPSDFYNIGSMGCASSIGNSIALQKPDKRVVILDGDGSSIMQMGSLTTIGHYRPKNLIHFILDNGSYESTGGQNTVSGSVRFDKIAINCGYEFSKLIKNKFELEGILRKIKNITGPALVVIKCNHHSRKDLGRPTKTPLENKNSFMKKI
jgi:phosphonopyruvate decarboxylase